MKKVPSCALGAPDLLMSTRRYKGVPLPQRCASVCLCIVQCWAGWPLAEPLEPCREEVGATHAAMTELVNAGEPGEWDRRGLDLGLTCKSRGPMDLSKRDSLVLYMSKGRSCRWSRDSCIDMCKTLLVGNANISKSVCDLAIGIKIQLIAQNVHHFSICMVIIPFFVPKHIKETVHACTPSQACVVPEARVVGSWLHCKNCVSHCTTKQRGPSRFPASQMSAHTCTVYPPKSLKHHKLPWSKR